MFSLRESLCSLSLSLSVMYTHCFQYVILKNKDLPHIAGEHRIPKLMNYNDLKSFFFLKSLKDFIAK